MASTMERIVNILFNRDDLIKMKKIDNINVKKISVTRKLKVIHGERLTQCHNDCNDVHNYK